MYLDNYIGEIKKICRDNGVAKLYAFGSVLTDRFSDSSDIDLLIDIHSSDPFDYSEKYFSLFYALQELLKRPVDLIEDRGIRNKYLRAEIDSTKKIIYGQD